MDPIFSPVAGQEYLENIKSPLGRTKTLLSSIFLELNFYTGDLGTQGNIWSHGWFFLLFLIGKYKLFKNQQKEKFYPYTDNSLLIQHYKELLIIFMDILISIL